jgi:hypothetical protein
VLTPHTEVRAPAGGGGVEPGPTATIDDDDARVPPRSTPGLGPRQTQGGADGDRRVDGAVARRFREPALASGGTGDVLAGTIGSLLAQGLAPFDAARLGVHLHGSAGEAVRQRVGDAGLLASDLPLEIALARRRLAEIAARRRAGRRLGFGAHGGPGDGRGDGLPDDGPDAGAAGADS